LHLRGIEFFCEIRYGLLMGASPGLLEDLRGQLLRSAYRSVAEIPRAVLRDCSLYAAYFFIR
jgi:hypothetical protein